MSPPCPPWGWWPRRWWRWCWRGRRCASSGVIRWPSSPATPAASVTVLAEHLVLVGMMAVGKTTVGRRVAEALGRPFSDSDELVEARTGRTVRDIFAVDGEAAYRVLETAALMEALEAGAPQVIAAAGGVVLAAANRAALRRPGVRVVWLR